MTFSLAETAGTYLKTQIEAHIRNQPRSLQTTIGPSEIGIPCTHCLGARLAGWPKLEPQIAWMPFIGTAMHAYYEQLFQALTPNVKGAKYFTEEHVTVGEIAGTPITGSTDLYITDIGDGSGMTVDWKIVGKTTLNKATRQGPSTQYITQAMLYAAGWNRAGWKTSHVCIYFQPRNSQTLDDGHIWVADFDPSIAENALTRVNQLANILQKIATDSGTKTRDAYITALPRDPNCWDCRKYADWGKNQLQVNKNPNFNQLINQ